MLANCGSCGKEINKLPGEILRNKAHGCFCNRTCYSNYLKKQTTKRFLSKIEKTESCWIWKGGFFNEGYGCFYLNGKAEGAHRVSWKLFTGEIPDGIMVCHDCPGGDNPACVNPDHLFLGTGKDNQADSVKKGTHVRGEKCRTTKLTADQVTVIRDLFSKGMSKSAIARQFGVTYCPIAFILNGKSWRHVF